MKSVQILGVPVHAYTYETWLSQIDAWIKESNTLHHICTVNPEFMVVAQHNPDFFNVLKNADACVADGTGILVAAKWLGEQLPSRITGSDGIYKIAERAAQDGWKLFFLGAAEGIAQQAADILKEKHPELQIVGTYAGSPDNSEATIIIDMVNQSQADMLLVAYGAPKQDLWIAKHREKLQVKVAMGVGGSFDFAAGIVPRAPRWMRKLGIEWLFRLIRQPWRWKRMLRLPIFLWYVWRYKSEPHPKLRKLQN